MGVGWFGALKNLDRGSKAGWIYIEMRNLFCKQNPQLMNFFMTRDKGCCDFESKHCLYRHSNN